MDGSNSRSNNDHPRKERSSRGNSRGGRGNRGNRGGGGGSFSIRGGRGGGRGGVQNAQPHPKETDQKQTVETTSPEAIIATFEAKKETFVRHTSNQVDEECCICFEPLDYFALGSCNHKNVCPLCCLRRRTILKQNECAFCKSMQDIIIIASDHKKKFEDYDLNKLKCNNNPKVYFDNTGEQYFQNLSQLWDFFCPICLRETGKKEDFVTLGKLKHHINQTHHMAFCSICLNDRQVFLQEQKIYLSKDIPKHYSTVDPDTRIEHRECRFCAEYFYDSDKLYYHLQEKHEYCNICKKSGKPDQYYKSLKELGEHFRKEHFMCNKPECLEKKVVAFATKMELDIHDREMHGNRTPLVIDFKVGGVRSPEDLDHALLADDKVIEPIPDDIGKQMQNKDQNFPTLDSQKGPTVDTRNQVWGSRATPSANSGESFPALSSSLYKTEVVESPNIGNLSLSYSAASRAQSLTIATPQTAKDPQLNPSQWGKSSGVPSPKPDVQNQAQFPSLPQDQKPKKKSPKQLVSISNSSNANPSSGNDFPTLGGKAPAPTLQWGKVAKEPEKPKPGDVIFKVGMNRKR